MWCGCNGGSKFTFKKNYYFFVEGPPSAIQRGAAKMPWQEHWHLIAGEAQVPEVANIKTRNFKSRDD
jgi:hypothetical protein